jgi:hypothetical protein
VPKQIAETINISEDNFQGQHALPFWFGETSGTIAKKLNKIVNLSLIDTSLSYLNSKLNRAKHTVAISESRLKESRRAKKELCFIIEMEKEWEAVKECYDQWKVLKREHSKLEDMLQTCKQHQETINAIKPPSLKALTTSYEALEKAEDEFTKMEIMIDKIEGLQWDLMNLQKQQTSLQQRMKKWSKRRCPLCGRKSRISQ